MKKHSRASDLGLIVILFGLALVMCGCSSAYSVHPTGLNGAYSYEKMNEVLKGEDVEIESVSGGKAPARDVTITGDSIAWRNSQTGLMSGTGVGQIRKISTKNSFLGGLKWMGVGAAVGALVGGIAAQAYPGTSESGEPMTAAGAAIGAGLGTIVGFSIGMGIGHRYDYEFPVAGEGDSLRIVP